MSLILQIVFLLGDLVFLGLIFLLIKRDRLSVRFGMLWLIFGGVWLIFAAVPWLLKVLRGVSGSRWSPTWCSPCCWPLCCWCC